MEERTDFVQAEGKYAMQALFLEDTAYIEKQNQTKIIQALIDEDEGTVEKEEECVTVTLFKENNTESDTVEDDRGYIIQALFKENATETEERNQTKMETTSQHISRATSTLETNDPHGYKCHVTQSACDQKETSANTA